MSACQTTALFRYGSHHTRTNSWDVQRPEDHSDSTLCNGWSDCRQAIRNDGSAWKVTSMIIPRAPRETRAARKSDGLLVALQRTVWPFASIKVRDRMHSDSSPCLRELPCVAVAMTPAIDWLSILPKFESVRPCFSSSTPRSLSRMPASTVTTPSGETLRTRLKSSRLTSQEEVQVRSEGE